MAKKRMARQSMAYKPTHDYTAPNLEQHLKIASDLYAALTGMLFLIQEETHIPGYHTDIKSDDDTAGVLERIQAIHEDDGKVSVAGFAAFDEDDNYGQPPFAKSLKKRK